MSESDEDMANMISKVSSLTPVSPPAKAVRPADGQVARPTRGIDQPTRSRNMENRRRNRKSHLGVKFFISLATLTFIIGMIVASLIYYAIVSQPTESKSFAGTGVVANGYECAAIGKSIILLGGSAVDAAIATLFCEGVANPHTMGLGGGFVMTIYKRTSQTAVVLNSRETAPEAAFKDMFENNSAEASKGGRAVAVPGELKGYYSAHSRYGRLDWPTLIFPTIQLCLRGHLVTPHFAKILQENEKEISKEPSLREIFINPETKKVYVKGDFIKRTKLARTLHKIARKGPNALYEGELTKNFIEDIKSFNGIITAKDLKFYSPTWTKPISKTFNNKWKMFTTPLPTSGIILTLILNILNKYLSYNTFYTVDNVQKIVESFKHAFAKRSELGDSDANPELQNLVRTLLSDDYAKTIRNKIRLLKTFENPDYYGANFSLKQDHGTANIAILAPNGDAVCVTSTINQPFGAGIRSRSTGIILNDQMDDFSLPNANNIYGVPPSENNFIVSKKRPVSSMCPTIVVGMDGEVMLVIGAAGGPRIISAVAWVILKYIWFDNTLSEAITSSRLHHQLMPMEILAEHDFSESILQKLKRIGHAIKLENFPNGFSAATGISQKLYFMESQFDIRRGGSTALIQM